MKSSISLWKDFLPLLTISMLTNLTIKLNVQNAIDYNDVDIIIVKKNGVDYEF